MNPQKTGNTFGNLLILAWMVIMGTVAVGMIYGIVIPLEFLTGITIALLLLAIVVTVHKQFKPLTKEAN